MTRKHSITKMISVLLAVMMLFTALVPAVSAAGVDGNLLPAGFRVTSETTYKVVNGVTERHFKINNASNSNQVKGYALEIDLGNPDISIVAGYNDGDTDGWGKATVRNQAYAIEKTRGVRVVGGVNGDFYNTSTGEPSGLLIMNSIVGKGANNRPYFAILTDGSAVIRSGNVSTADVVEGVGGNQIIVKNNVITSGLNATDAQPRAAVGIKADGSVVFFVADGRQQPDSYGMTYEQLAQTMLSLGCEIALNLDSGGSSTLVGRREAGSDISVINYPSYMGVERAVANSILVCSSAKPTGVFDHVTFSQDNYACNPTSWVTVSYKGVDENGYAETIPSGGKLVLSDDSYGYMLGNVFHAKGKSGTVTLSYEINGEVVGSATIEISSDTDTASMSMFKQFLQFFFNIINTMQTVFEKLRSGTSNTF